MWRRRRTSGAWPAGPQPAGPLLPWLLLLALASTPLAGDAAFCDDFNVRDTGVLHLARKTNENEQRKVQTSLRLRCCAKHYDEIRWFRVNDSIDEEAPPQNTNLTLVRLPNARHASFDELIDDNRTLLAGSAQARDSGWYLCEARNDTEGAAVSVIRHWIKVQINVDKPLNSSVLEDTYEVRIQRLGDKTKITCSMVSGTPLLWFRTDGIHTTFPFLSYDGRILPNVKVGAIKSFIEGNTLKEVNGQAIYIDSIQPENFGTYLCYQNKIELIRTVILKEGGYRRELKVTVICLSLLFIIFAILGPFCWYWRIEIRLFWKDRFGKLEENDDKVYDVFVSYDAEDAPFVLGTLVPVLEDHFRYRCFAWERDSIAGDWIPETLVQSVQDSRRFLMILSPALLENRWCTFALHVALKAVLQLQLHIICVKLHDVDWSQVQLADKSANETIRQVLHVVRTVVWEPSKEKSRALSNQQIVTVKDKSLLNFNKFSNRKNSIPEEDVKAPGRSRFWRKLRLYLPPRRTLPLLSKPPASPTSTKSLLSLPHGSDCC